MRTEQQMMDLLLSVAQKDERIRAVAMNGSRTNPNVPKDPFQDYDIVFLVTDLSPYLSNPDWITVFGEQIIMQTPESMSLLPPELGGRFTYLMLFSDGNRIDLMLIPTTDKEKYCREDKLTRILLDKDHALPDLPAPSDEDYHVNQPTAAHFADCCNEFWGVSTYVAKGLWRQELLYALDHLNGPVRSMLLQMLDWRVGIENHPATVSTGKSHKYLQKYVSKSTWDMLLTTFPAATYQDTWRALFAMGELFRETAMMVGGHYRFLYNHQEDSKVLRYLQHVKQLPQDAKEIY